MQRPPFYWILWNRPVHRRSIEHARWPSLAKIADSINRYTLLIYFAICSTDEIPHPNTEKRTTDCTSQVSIAFCPSLSLSATAFGIMRCSSCSLLCRSSSSFRKFSSSVFPLSNNFDLKEKERKKFSSIYVSRYGMKAIIAAWQIQTISWRVFIGRGVITTLRHQFQLALESTLTWSYDFKCSSSVQFQLTQFFRKSTLFFSFRFFSEAWSATPLTWFDWAVHFAGPCH